jgi:hypothetical protein
MANEAELRNQLAGEIDRLRLLAASSTNPCLVTQYIAFSNHDVQELFVKKTAAGDRFKTCTCLPSAPDCQQYVLFEFDCPEGLIRLVKPSFLAVVDMPKREVAKVIDPYLPDQLVCNPPPGSLPFALTVPSNAPNVTIPANALKPFQAREEAYGSALGLNVCRLIASTCTVSTVYLSTTPSLVSVPIYSPFPVQDDSQAMYAQDTQLESMADTIVDDRPNY